MDGPAGRQPFRIADRFNRTATGEILTRDVSKISDIGDIGDIGFKPLDVPRD